MAAKLRVTLVKSTVSHTARTRGTVRALGLHRIGQSVEIDDTPVMRGMTRAVAFLLRTEQLDGAVEPATEQSTASAPPADTATEPAGEGPARRPPRKPAAQKEEATS